MLTPQWGHFIAQREAGSRRQNRNLREIFPRRSHQQPHLFIIVIQQGCPLFGNNTRWKMLQSPSKVDTCFAAMITEGQSAPSQSLPLAKQNIPFLRGRVTLGEEEKVRWEENESHTQKNKRHTERHLSVGDATEESRQINFILMMYQEEFLPDFTDPDMNNLNCKVEKYLCVCVFGRVKGGGAKKLIRQQMGNPRGDHRRVLGKLGRIFKDCNLQSNYPSVISLYEQVKTWFPRQSVSLISHTFFSLTKPIIRQMLILKVPFVLILFTQQTVTTYNSLTLLSPQNWCRRWTLKAGSCRISAPLMSSSANNLMEILECVSNRS